MSSVQTPYYLITDADTFFLRSFEALDLLHQEEGCTKTSGVCDLQKQVLATCWSSIAQQARVVFACWVAAARPCCACPGIAS